MKRFLWLIVLAAGTLIMPGTLKASSGVTQVSGGYYFNCALINGGVQCWGLNHIDYGGQLGDGTTTQRALPVQVVGLESGVTALSDSGANTTCAVQNGAAKCWGNNRGGPLGDGTASPRVEPVQVVGLTSGVTAISVGNYHACAVVNGGVWCWGSNYNGVLGNGTTTDSYVPVQVSGLTSGATAITASSRSCAIVNGGMQCWGLNEYGELGDGTTTTRLTPVPVAGLTSGVTAIKAAGQTTCAIVNGGLQCWGFNSQGQIGDGTAVHRTTPVEVTGLTSGVTAIGGNAFHLCAAVNGAAQCWGYNGYGTLGNGTTTDSLVPVQVSGLTSGVTDLSAGLYHTCAAVSGGAKCWGSYNGSNFESGPLGNGTILGSTTPLDVIFPNPPSGGGGGSQIPTDFLAYWPLNETSGAVIDVGGGHHGMAVGVQQGVPGVAGRAAHFDGNSYVLIPHTPDFPRDQVSILSWVKFDSVGNYPMFLSGGGNDGQGWDYALYATPEGRFRAAYRAADGSTPYVDAHTAIQLGTWYHAAMTHDGHNLSIYVNGVLEATIPAPPLAPSTRDFYLGRESRLECCFLSGYLDEVQLYGRSLQAGELAAIHQAGVDGEPLDDRVEDGPSDSTAPAITHAIGGTLGNNGWYTSDVTVTFTATDGESAVTTAGCDAQSVTSDTAGVTFTCTATSAGGSTSDSVTVKRDTAAPAISGSRSPAANTSGWNNTNVAVSFACSDSLSGIASCAGDATQSSEGPGQSVQGLAIDGAGNTASTDVTGINIDKTAPSVAITSPANGASYTLGQAVAASYTCSDVLSTVASCSGTTAAGAGINTASVGTKSFSVTATDKAGNSTPSTVSYTVGYVFGGFLQPLQAPVTTFKAGSTIPVKFKLTNAGGAAVTTATAQVSANGAPQGSAAWDGEQYHFNLKTKGLPSGSLTISVALNDGTTKSVTVTLKP